LFVSVGEAVQVNLVVRCSGCGVLFV
jgi:hypothetical protein